jgi:hypothetical protein
MLIPGNKTKQNNTETCSKILKKVSSLRGSSSSHFCEERRVPLLFRGGHFLTTLIVAMPLPRDKPLGMYPHGFLYRRRHCLSFSEVVTF